jgi:predicted transcriptional regulator
VTKEPVTILLEKETKQAIDAVAARGDRDAESVIREAIDTYLDVEAWQDSHIQEGLRQADAGEFASDEQVARVFSKWRA